MAYRANDRTTSRRLHEPETLFGRVLDEVLSGRGSSASEVARHCGLSRTRVSRMRSGDQGVTFANVADLEWGLSLSGDEVDRLLVAALGDARKRSGRTA